VSPTLLLTELLVASLNRKDRWRGSAWGELDRSANRGKSKAAFMTMRSASQWSAGCVAITSHKEDAIFA
jgi:hypothetical protein